MKRKFKMFSVLLTIMIVAQLTVVSFAEDAEVVEDTSEEIVTEDVVTEETEDVLTEEVNKEGKGKGKGKSEKAGKAGLGNLTKEERKTFLGERKAIREQIKEAYSQEDVELVSQNALLLQEKYPDMKILPFDSIISNKYGFKFDVPPVIKEGRTLIPVRAITEGLGADVDWDGETKTVTITKTTTEGSVVIVMVLDENVVTVNGEEVVLDTEAKLFNNRTFVPIRFIAETFGLNVDWFGEDETISIDEDIEEEEEEVVVVDEEEVVVEEEVIVDEEEVVVDEG